MKKNYSAKNSLQAVAALSAAVLLSACTGNTPAPCTDVTVVQAPPQAETTQPLQADSTHATETQNVSAGTSANKIENIKRDTIRIEVPVNRETVIEKVRIDTVVVSVPQAVAPELPPDPYQDFPALAYRVFVYADSLYKQGAVDSAVSYLQRFRIIKPLWNQWQNSTDSLLQKFGKTNAEMAKQFEPLVMQIQNMNRVRTAYSMVAETADSLIALAPGDSLVNFAKEQKKIAYQNDLKRAQNEIETIKELADQRAQFAEAETRAVELQMRYRDFEEELKIQALIDHVRSLAQDASAEALKYWEKNDPVEAMKKVDQFIAASKYSQANELLAKLKASKLRKEAMEKQIELADAYCNAQRKETSQLFAKAQKQKDNEKKKALIQSAIAPLDKCIEQYPQSTLIQKVKDNKTFLEKELKK